MKTLFKLDDLSSDRDTHVAWCGIGLGTVSNDEEELIPANSNRREHRRSTFRQQQVTIRTHIM